MIKAISYFQLENLILHSIPFELCFLESITPYPLSKRFLKVKKDVSLKSLKTTKDKQKPMVFLCSQGNLSLRTQEEFEKQGYKNVFYFQGGFKVLELFLKEL